MVFFDLSNIEVMLNTTHDVMADFINAICADLVAIASKMSYEEFIENTSKLNELESYPQLTQRAQRIGYTINKVVYRGYHASDKLQQMHDRAIESRTSLKLEGETEEQSQRLADMKLSKELERSKRRQDMLESEKTHEIKMENLKHESVLKMKKAEEVQANENRLNFLNKMKEMGVDLTKYLICQYQNPDKIIKIDNSSEGTRPNIHFHEK